MKPVTEVPTSEGGDRPEELVSRLLALYRSHTSDLAPAQRLEPAYKYSDEDLWHTERRLIHRRAPLPLALSCELPAPLAWKATSAVGVPVLIARDGDGAVHASLNVCRHRGAPVAPVGCGSSQQFTCPFHGWSYDSTGRLDPSSVSELFGPAGNGERDLFRLPVEEACGLIFVCLELDGTIELQEWLGRELMGQLDALELWRYDHHSLRSIEGPNWKLVSDGYLESYHVGTLHRDSVLSAVVPEIAAFDTWGPHMRHTFALQTIKEANDQSELRSVGRPVFWLFPGLNISGGGGDIVAVSLILPGQSVGSSVTAQHILVRKDSSNADLRSMANRVRDGLYATTLTEDHPVAQAIQDGLESIGSQPVVFGRNEPGIQHFHRAISRFIVSSS